MANGRFELDDLGRVLVPSSPARWGERVVYVLRRTDKEGQRYKTALWAVPASGGEALRLTAGEHADRLPMPGDGALYFVSDRERGDQVWCLRRDGGDATRVTSLGHGSIGGGALSPDGKTLVLVFTAASSSAVLATERVARPGGDDGPAEFDGPLGEGKFEELPAVPAVRVYARPHTRTDGAGWEGGFVAHLWLVDIATGKARRLTSGPANHGAPAWGPGGGYLVATRTAVPGWDRDPTRNEVIRVGLDGQVTVMSRPDGYVETLSVDEKGRIAYVHAAPDDMWGAKNPLLGVIDEGGARLLGADLDRPVGDLALDDLAGLAFVPWPPLWDGDGVIVTVTDGSSARLCRIGLDGSHRWLSPAGACTAMPVRTNAGLVALHGSPSQFVELARGEERLTRHNDALAADLMPRRPEEVWVEVDGVKVQGWYLSPRGRNSPAPGILYIHGGPHANYGVRLFFEMQWLADQGFAVTWTNPRGSHGFGEQYNACVDPHWGDIDSRDQLALVEHMAARPEVDGERIGVTGGSYGGFMTLYLAAHTRRFKAAVSDRGLYDWALDTAGGDFGHAIPDMFGCELPWRDPSGLSPYSLLRVAHQVDIPFLVMHGDLDLRCDRTQALALYETLLRKGVPTALCLFPEENHGMSRGGRLDRRKERMRQIAAWFRRYL